MNKSFATIAQAVKDTLDGLPAEQRVSTYDLSKVLAFNLNVEGVVVQQVLQTIVACEGTEAIGRYFHREKAVCRNGKNAGKTIMRAIWHRPYPLELKGAA